MAIPKFITDMGKSAGNTWMGNAKKYVNALQQASTNVANWATPTVSPIPEKPISQLYQPGGYKQAVNNVVAIASGRPELVKKFDQSSRSAGDIAKNIALDVASIPIKAARVGANALMSGVKSSFIPVQAGNNSTVLAKAKADSLKMQSITPTPTPTVDEEAYVNAIKQGLSAHKADPQVIALAQKYAELQKRYNIPDKYLIPIMAIMETGGGRWFKGYDAPTEEQRAAEYEKWKNNPYNWGIASNSAGVPGTIEDITEKVYSGIAGRVPAYQDYMKSGDMADFFKHYTPETDPRNPTQAQLIERYKKIRKAFEEAEAAKQ